jgi:SAM-dependent methyltransferase
MEGGRDGFHETDGIFVPARPPRHRDEEFDEAGFDLLLRMQRGHFWYRGRHKLLLNILRREVRRRSDGRHGLRGVDLGGGCGGWIEYLHAHAPAMFDELALGDSSLRALMLARPVVGSIAKRYHIDLLDLAWSDEWDVVFLLDVLEHIPDHVEALRQIRRALHPGGLLFVTTPALQAFWTYNDELVHHQRRYSSADFIDLAARADLRLVRTDYFMFFLSPVLLASRLLLRPQASATPEEVLDHMMRTHRIPPRPINEGLAALLSLEAAIVGRVGFPWGTSVFALFERPVSAP